MGCLHLITGTMNNLIDLSGMALFVNIVESGSLSAAGRMMDMPKATVSRQLIAIEKRTGAVLLRRSTRALTLTDFGRRYYERIRPIVRAAELAQAETLATHATPCGMLRIAASVAYGQRILAPRIFAFQQKYPSVSVDLRLSDERINLIADGFDVAIRMGQLQDSQLVCRCIDKVHMVLVASPSYLDAVGVPNSVADLSGKQAVLTRPDLDQWVIDGVVVRMQWRTSTGSMLLTLDAARAGLGLAMIPSFLAQEFIASGNLIRVLPHAQLAQTEVNAVFVRSPAASVALHALMTALRQDDGTLSALLHEHKW